MPRSMTAFASRSGRDGTRAWKREMPVANGTGLAPSLRAHLAAARGLLAQGSPVGRTPDFPARELMREAKTPWSRAQHAEVPAPGHALGTVIDPMREQIRNVA